MRILITAEANGEKRQPHLPEPQIAEVLRRHGLRLVSIERQHLPLVFLGWARRGGRWQAVAAGVSKADVRAAVEGVEREILVLPLGVQP
jgi:hypothetical protein